MRIEWRIEKKAGHLRPKLRYKMVLAPFEISLAVPMVRIESTIPKPVDAWQGHVWPKSLERGGKMPEAVYNLCSPSHKTGACEDVLTLPMRTDNSFPEVKDSFLSLQAAYEEALLAAYENSAFETAGCLDMTPETKRRIAPGAAAARFLVVLDRAS